VTPLPPFSVPRELSETTMRAAAGNVAAAVAAASLDETVDASVDLLMPSSAAGRGGGAPALCRPRGVALILPGFLLSARRSYRTLAAHLVSHGFAAALVDVDDPSASDVAMARACAAAASSCVARAAAAAAAAAETATAAGGGGARRGAASSAAAQQRRRQTRPAPSPLPVLLIGHSRGAKIAALAAGGWDRLAPRGNGSVGPAAPPALRGLVLLDPVDRATLGPPPGPAYPPSLPSVREVAARGGVPILIVGAGDNADIVQGANGWQAFSAAAAAGAAQQRGGAPASAPARVFELLLPRARHLDFADTQGDPLVGAMLGLFGGADARGGGRPAGEAAAVRRCAAAAAAFWASLACGMIDDWAQDGRGGGDNSSLAAVEAEAAALRRLLVPDARWRAVAWAGEPGRGAAGSAGAAAGAVKGSESREELSAARASHLQALLRERGVYYGDCFDKAALVERVLSSSASVPRP